jgi:hypothetical protein
MPAIYQNQSGLLSEKSMLLKGVAKIIKKSEKIIDVTNNEINAVVMTVDFLSGSFE